jgi:hypothetical protein
MREIKESDWKIFRQLHKVALERFCERILSEIERVNAESTKTAHQKYLEIYDLTRRRNEEVAALFDDFRRSTAFFQIVAMKQRDLFTEEEYSRFSEEIRNRIDSLLGLAE